MAAILGLVLWFDGAHLARPADPAERYPARPDWYFMFLSSSSSTSRVRCSLVGIYIPAFIVGLLFLMPFIGRWKQGHRFNLIFLYTLLGGFVYLTYIAYAKDAKDEEFQFAQEQAHKDAGALEYWQRLRPYSSGWCHLPTSWRSLHTGPQDFRGQVCELPRLRRNGWLGTRIKRAAISA